jgi:hypothetical protein
MIAAKQGPGMTVGGGMKANPVRAKGKRNEERRSI